MRERGKRVALPHQAGVEEPKRRSHEHDERSGHEDPGGVAGVYFHGQMLPGGPERNSDGVEESGLPFGVAAPRRRYSVVTV